MLCSHAALISFFYLDEEVCALDLARTSAVLLLIPIIRTAVTRLAWGTCTEN
jgi:hypothetical protein